MSMRELSVYLAGPINGLTIEEATGWRNHIINYFFNDPVHFFNPMKGKDHVVKSGEVITNTNLDPHFTKIFSAHGIFSRDINMINASDIVFAHFPHGAPISHGTMFEIGYAYANHKIIIASMNGNNGCDRIGFLNHPFVSTPCVCFGDLDLAIDYLEYMVEDFRK